MAPSGTSVQLLCVLMLGVGVGGDVEWGSFEDASEAEGTTGGLLDISLDHRVSIYEICHSRLQPF